MRWIIAPRINHSRSVRQRGCLSPCTSCLLTHSLIHRFGSKPANALASSSALPQTFPHIFTAMVHILEKQTASAEYTATALAQYVASSVDRAEQGTHPFQIGRAH